MENYKISWRRGNSLSNDILIECAALFSNHYGCWGASAEPGRVGKQVKLKPDQLSPYLKAPESWAALAYADESLVGYAFSQRLQIPNKGYVTWVTQFVVHSEHRRQGLGTRLLRAIWSVSDQYAWGLVTANPYAVRALENATLRDCDPDRIRASWPQLYEAANPYLDYVAAAGPHLRLTTTALNTNFPVDHSDSTNALREMEKSRNWCLGNLNEAEEWAAFTFAGQPYSEDAITRLDRWIKDCDLTVRDAYNGMSLDINHKWAKHASHEIDVFISKALPSRGQLIIDFGCGIGRHSIELAKRGFRVIGIDFVPSLIEAAQENAKATGVTDQIQFVCGDVREIKLEQKADHAICLYDVVGSFAADSENKKLLENMFSHLKPGGGLFISVMNGELTAAKAIHRATNDLAEKLLQLLPSRIMQSTGNVFDPNFYLWDELNGVVYRKEQFVGDAIAPCELVVRDRRYSSDSLISICGEVGFEVLDLRFVKLGDWNHGENALGNQAKEILVFCRKP